MNATVVESCPVEVQQLRFRNVGNLHLLPDSDPGYSPSNSCQSLAASSRYNVLVAGCGYWLVIAPASQPVSSSCRRIKLPQAVSHVAISCDQLTLLVVCHPPAASTGRSTSYLYDVRLLAASVLSVEQPLPSPCATVELVIGSSSPDRIQQIEFSPVASDTLAIVYSSGSVAVLRLDVATGGVSGCCAVQRVGWLSGDQAVACCVAWSRKGKQLVVGRCDGVLVQYKPELSEARRISAPSLVSDTAGTPRRCVSIIWLSTYEFICGYCGSSGDTEMLLMHVTAPKQGAVQWVNYGDPCFSSGGGNGGSGDDPARALFQLAPLFDWHVIVVASSRSIELAVLGSEDQQQQQQQHWLQLVMDDDARPELPLSNGCEQYPAGVTLALSSTQPVDWLEGSKLPPAPLLHVLTAQSAMLYTFALINVRPDVKPITAPGENISAQDLAVARARGCVNILSGDDRCTGKVQPLPVGSGGTESAPVSASSGVFSGAAATALSILSSAAQSASVARSVSGGGAVAAVVAKGGSMPLKAPESSVTPLSRAEVVKPQSESTPATQQISNAALNSAISEEVAALRKEVRSVCSDSDGSGSVAKVMREVSLSSCRLSADAECLAVLGQFTVDMRTTLAELAKEIDALNADSLQSVGVCEEVRSLLARAGDARLQHLLRLRPPPAAQLKRLAELQRLQAYLQSQLVSANRVLDDQWNNSPCRSSQQRYTQKPSRLGDARSSGDASDTASTIYAVLANNRVVISRLRAALDGVLSGLPVSPRSAVVTGSAASVCGDSWSDRQLQLVTEQLAATGLASSSRHSVPGLGAASSGPALSDLRRSKLHRALAERRVVPVRRVSDDAAAIIADSCPRSVPNTGAAPSGSAAERSSLLPGAMTSTPLAKSLSVKTVRPAPNNAAGQLVDSAVSAFNLPSSSVTSQSLATSSVFPVSDLVKNNVTQSVSGNFSISCKEGDLANQSQNRSLSTSVSSAVHVSSGFSTAFTQASNVLTVTPSFTAAGLVKTAPFQSAVSPNVTVTKPAPIVSVPTPVGVQAHQFGTVGTASSSLFSSTSVAAVGTSGKGTISSSTAQSNSNWLTGAMAKSTGAFTLAPSTKTVSFGGLAATVSKQGGQSLGVIAPSTSDTLSSIGPESSTILSASRQTPSSVANNLFGVQTPISGALEGVSSAQIGVGALPKTTSSVSFLPVTSSAASGGIFGSNTILSGSAIKQSVSNVLSTSSLAKPVVPATSLSFLQSTPSDDRAATLTVTTVVSTTKAGVGNSLFSPPSTTSVPSSVLSFSSTPASASNTVVGTNSGPTQTINPPVSGASTITAVSKNLFGAAVSVSTSSVSGATSLKFGAAAVSTGVGAASTSTGIIGSASNVTTASIIPSSVSSSSAPGGLFGSASSSGNLFGGAVSTTPSGLFSAIPSSSGSVFGAVASSTSASPFGTTPSVSGNLFGGTKTSTSVSPFGNTSSGSGSVFGATTTTTSGAFVTSSGSGSVFGATTTTTSGLFGTTSSGSGFGGTSSSTSGSLFGTTTAASGNVFGGAASPNKSVFGTTSSSSNLFGGAVSSAPSSVFGTPFSSANVFGTVSSASSSVFGSQSGSGSIFNSATSTKPNGVFGNGSGSSGSVFGAAVSSAPSAVFGATAPSSTNFFGGAVSSNSVFGSATSPSSSSVFGGAPSTSAGLFGSSGGLGGLGLGGAASSERAATNVFGGGSGSVFGQSPSSLFAAPPGGTAAASPAASPAKSSAFGAPPAFGSPTGSFGSAPSFGAGSPAFGTAPSPSSNGAFGAAQALPSFGSLAGQGSSSSSFGALSSGAGQFGSASAPGNQQFSGSSFTSWR